VNRLTRLIVSGLKGQSFDEQLSGCDLFVGPNGSGKSTRLIAVQAGLWGCAGSPSDARRPFLGDRPEATVELFYDCDGATKVLRRNLADAPRAGAKSTDRATAAAEVLVGEHVVRADLGDWVTDSPAKRDELLRRLCAAAGWTAAQALTELRRQVGEKKDTAPAASRAIDALMRLTPATGEGSVWLDKATTWASATLTTCNAQADTAGVEVVNAQQAQRAAPSAPAGGAVAARERLAEARARRDALVASQATVLAAVREVREHTAEGQRLAERYGAAETALTTARATLAQLEAALGGEIDERALTAARAALAVADRADDNAARRVREARSAHEAAVRSSADAEARADTLRDLLHHAGAPEETTCGACGAADPLGLRDLLTTFTAQAAAAGVAEAEAETALKVALDTAKRRTMALNEARAAVRSAESAVLSRQAEIARAVERAEAGGEVVKRAEARLAEATADLDAWRQRAAPAPASLAGTDPAEELAAIDATIAAAEAEGKACETAAALELAVQAAVAKRAAAEERLAGIRAVQASLKATSAALVLAGSAPVRTLADAALARMALPWTVETRAGSEVWVRGVDADVALSFWALSDAERAIVALALAVAFVRLGQPRWPALILDGMERIDTAHLESVLHGLAEMVAAGELANVMGALVSDDPGEVPVVEGMTVHWLGMGTGAAREAA